MINIKIITTRRCISVNDWATTHVTGHVTPNMAAASDSTDSAVRKRRVETRKTESISSNSKDNAEDISKKKKEEKRLRSLQPGTYWLTRIVLLRAVAFIYCKQTLLTSSPFTFSNYRQHFHQDIQWLMK